MVPAFKRLMIGLAWIFAVGSLAALGFLMSMRGTNFTGTSTIMNVTVGDESYHAPWFYYTGTTGTPMLYSQAALVMLAIGLSVLPGALRRVGHIMLIVWSLMWLVMPPWLWWNDPNRGGEWIALTIVFAACSLATIVRAIDGWGSSSKQLGETAEPTLRRSLHQLVSGLAWLFLIASVVPLAVLLVAAKGWVGEGSATVFQTTTNGQTFTALGLGYHGPGGSLLLWGEFIGVIAALLLSAHVHVVVRRIALLVLLGWSLLLLGNAWWLRSAANWDVLPGAAVGVTAGFACVMYLVVARWGRSPRQLVKIDVAAGENHAHSLNAARS